MAESPSGLKLISKILADILREDLRNCTNEEETAKVVVKTMFDALGMSGSKPSSTRQEIDDE